MWKKLNDWWGTQSQFEQFKDAFSVSQKMKLSNLKTAIDRRRAQGDTISLVAHFPETFETLQDFLETHRIPYAICQADLDQQELLEHARKGSDQVLLVLAESIKLTDTKPQLLDQRITLAAMIAERYPIPSRDERIGKFFRTFPTRTRLGYFLSLDDPTLRFAISATTLQLLQQMGLDEQELITSSMMSRRMQVVLTRVERGLLQERSADSAAEWWQLNGPKS